MKKIRYMVILDRDTGVDREGSSIWRDEDAALGHAKGLCTQFGIETKIELEDGGFTDADIGDFELGFGNEKATVFIFEKAVIGG